MRCPARKEKLNHVTEHETDILVPRSPNQCERTSFPISFASSVNRKNVFLCKNWLVWRSLQHILMKLCVLKHGKGSTDRINYFKNRLIGFDLKVYSFHVFFSRQSNSWFVVFFSANVQHCCCVAIIIFKWSSTRTSISKQVRSKWTNRHLSNSGAGWGWDSLYGLLTKCEIKMAGYWPSSFFVCLWTESKSWSINTQKKHEDNIQPSGPKQAWSKKDLLY